MEKPDPTNPDGDLKHLEGGDRPLAVELIQFLATHKKYWLLPVVLVLLLISLLIVVAGSAAAPFIYPLF